MKHKGLKNLKSGKYNTIVEKVFWYAVAIILIIIWFGPFLGIGDWGGRSGVGCYQDGPDEWVCERP